jgi:two-component system response regulator MtrA
VKPFEPSVLTARIKARLRPITSLEEAVTIGPLTLDVVGHQVLKNGSQISLTPLEFNLLLTLAQKPKQVFTREMLLEKVWGYHYKADTRLVNVHVQRLRSKIEEDPDNPKIVTTVRGIGYRAG